jgi:hypothetical protein
MWEALESPRPPTSCRHARRPRRADRPGRHERVGGQRQRLAIARALVRRPDIYLFDDSFSALDLATDARLRPPSPRTAEAAVLIVAQRVSTIIDADQILVLEDGVIVGLGTHDELWPPARPTSRSWSPRPPPTRPRHERPGEHRRTATATAQQRRTRSAADDRAARAPAAGPGAAGRAHEPVGVPRRSKPTSAATVRRLGRLHGAETGSLVGVWPLAVASVVMVVLGPRILGQATDIVVDGLTGRNGADGIDFARCTARCTWRSASTSAPTRSPTCRRISSPAWCSAPCPPARRGRGQAAPAAAELRRPPRPRRPAQPGHQRHRQHRPEPAADAEPDADLAAHDRRRGRDDVRGSRRCWPSSPGHHPAVDRG